jgi:hypothetical protein
VVNVMAAYQPAAQACGTQWRKETSVGTVISVLTHLRYLHLTLTLLTTTIVAPPSNAGKWQMGFNSEFKGLIAFTIFCT